MDTQKGGFIQLLIIIILLIVILSLLGVSISSFVHNTTLRENFAFVWSWIVHIWNTYLVGAIKNLWGSLVN